MVGLSGLGISFSPCGIDRTGNAVPTMFRALISLCLLATVVSAETLELLWPDLQGEVGEFEDPFTALNSDQLFHLGMVARLRAMAQANPDSFPVEDAAELAKFTKDLEESGINIDGLLAKREAITTLRRQRANSTRLDYEGKVIRLPGYLLPLDITEGEVTEFLLVPWVGACIHTPPPPPNQIVYVRAAEPWKVRGQWEPVYVEGTMKVGDVTKGLYFVDGSADIHIGYTLIDTRVTPFEDD